MKSRAQRNFEKDFLSIDSFKNQSSDQIQIAINTCSKEIEYLDSELSIGLKLAAIILGIIVALSSIFWALEGQFNANQVKIYQKYYAECEVQKIELQAQKQSIKQEIAKCNEILKLLDNAIQKNTFILKDKLSNALILLLFLALLPIISSQKRAMLKIHKKLNRYQVAAKKREENRAKEL